MGKEIMSEFIPVCEPTLIGNEEKYVLDAVKSGWVSSAGEYINKFESEFSKYVGVEYSSTCSSGTAALHLGLLALGVGPGDEVIIPNFTMIASAFAVCYAGATPVFVDCDSTTWNIDSSKIEEKITGKTRAIMLVPIFGHPCDFDRILKIAKEKGIRTIEDAAEAIGSEYNGKMCGSFCDVSCFSLYGNKTITSGEGGMVVTNDKSIIDEVNYYKNMAFDLKGPRNYSHEKIGYNYRMNNITAALGVAQLENASKLTEMRSSNAASYTKELESVEEINLQPAFSDGRNSFWMYGGLLNSKAKVSRDEVMERLKKEGIGTRAFFTPMHLQPCLLEYGASGEGSYENSLDLGKNGFYLPSTSHLSEAQINRVSQSLKKIFS